MATYWHKKKAATRANPGLRPDQGSKVRLRVRRAIDALQERSPHAPSTRALARTPRGRSPNRMPGTPLRRLRPIVDRRLIGKRFAQGGPVELLVAHRSKVPLHVGSDVAHAGDGGPELGGR